MQIDTKMTLLQELEQEIMLEIQDLEDSMEILEVQIEVHCRWLQSNQWLEGPGYLVDCENNRQRGVCPYYDLIHEKYMEDIDKWMEQRMRLWRAEDRWDNRHREVAGWCQAA